MRSLIGSLWVCALVEGSSSAQTVLWEVSGSGPGTVFGNKIRSVGDFDGDGLQDLLVGEPGFNPGGLVDAGRATLYSGATQAVLFSVAGTAPALGLIPGGAVGRELSAPGDLTGDGILELVLPVAGGPCFCPGVVQVHSPPAGLLASLEGDTAAVVGDLDGDGLADLLVGQWWWPSPGCTVGRAYAVSGFGGPVVAQYTGPPCGLDGIGKVVEPMGDLTGDGIPEFAIGAAGYWPAFLSWVRIQNIQSPSPLWAVSFLPFTVECLASLGDINGDGVNDIAVGAPSGGPGGTIFVPPPPVGQVTVLSGADGSSLQTWYGSFLQQRFGLSVGHLGDLDGDGHADVLVGGPATLGWVAPTPVPANWPTAIANPGRTEIFSGATGLPLLEIVESPPYEGFGLSVDGFGDLDGDDYPDFAASEPWRPLTVPGRAIAYSGRPTGLDVFGAGCGGPGAVAPRIAGWPSPAVGTTLRLSVSLARPNSPGLLILGGSGTSWYGIPLPLALGFLGLPSCGLLVSPDLLLPLATVGPATGLGAATLSIPISQDPALVSLTFFAQGYVVDPGPGILPGTMTRGLSISVQP